MAVHRLEFGFVDYRDPKGDLCSLYFQRTISGKGRGILRTGPEQKDVRLTAPSSFVRCCDVIAGYTDVVRVWGLSNRNVRGSIEGNRWVVQVGSGDVVARGLTYPGFDTPHEIVHGLTVCMTFNWFLDGQAEEALEGETYHEYKRQTEHDVPAKGFSTTWSIGRHVSGERAA